MPTTSSERLLFWRNLDAHIYMAIYGWKVGPPPFTSSHMTTKISPLVLKYTKKDGSIVEHWTEVYRLEVIPPDCNPHTDT